MSTLRELALRYGTDKARCHDYITPYEKWFEPLRNTPITILEIGVYQGASIRMWGEYFTHPDSKIIGFDNNSDCAREYDDSRIEIVIGDQSDFSDLYNMAQKRGHFSVIIDDGSHRTSHQQYSFNRLYGYLNDGGIYAIEDLHTSEKEHYMDSEVSTIEFLSRMVTPVTMGRHDVSTIEFHKNLCIMQKGQSK